MRYSIPCHQPSAETACCPAQGKVIEEELQMHTEVETCHCELAPRAQKEYIETDME